MTFAISLPHCFVPSSPLCYPRLFISSLNLFACIFLWGVLGEAHISSAHISSPRFNMSCIVSSCCCSLWLLWNCLFPPFAIRSDHPSYVSHAVVLSVPFISCSFIPRASFLVNMSEHLFVIVIDETLKGLLSILKSGSRFHPQPLSLPILSSEPG